MAAAVAGAKPSRRSVRSLSVQEKVHAIDRVHEGESKASVARDIGVPESTLRGWCKGEEKLRGIVARSSGGNPAGADATLDDSFEKTTKFGLVENQNSLANSKRDYSSLDEALNQSTVPKKFPKLDQVNDVPIIDIKVNQRNLESPINFSKNSENDSRNSYSPTTSSLVFPKGEELGRDAHHALNPSLPALAAIASAFSNKNQMLYNAYTNGMLKNIVPKQESNKPLDYSTKVPSRLPRPDMKDALMFWLQTQREQPSLPMSPMEARTADSSSWFWKLYKNCGMLPQTTSACQKAVDSNGHTTQTSDEEDEPPATAADAVRHGEKFLRWLECCSDPSVTALQILQFRYLLNNVKECAERRRQVRTKTRSRRK